MKQLNIGTYYPVATYLHILDARVKVVATTMVTILLFFTSSFWAYGLLACFLATLILTAKLPLRLLRTLSSLRYILIFTLFFSVFMTPGEQVLFGWSWLYATREGLMAGIILIIRVTLMIFVTTILTLTTPTIELTSAFEFLLSPLQKLRFPVAEGALMINLALRFIPTIMEENQRIMNSQKARGVSFEAEGLMGKVRSIIPVLIPLILSSFKRAEDLALAMEARNFKIGGKRTSYRMMRMTSKDYKILLVMLLFFLCMIGFEIMVN